jgi:L-asparaginase
MKITFVQTGGTIDKDYPKTTKGWAFEIDKPAVERILKKLNPSFEYEILSAFKKDSLVIDEGDRKYLFQMIDEIDNDKIIITHGTDTMIETATFLSAIANKTIILTGAMKPERFYNSDASINIGVAIGALNILTAGVYISMHGIVKNYDKIKRDLETGKYY